MSKPGYRSISLPDEIVDELVKIGEIQLVPMGVEPTPPAVIKMLVKLHKAQLV